VKLSKIGNTMGIKSTNCLLSRPFMTPVIQVGDITVPARLLYVSQATLLRRGDEIIARYETPQPETTGA
jgi:hypothetical protein